MKNYVGISRDHSGSMQNIALAAGRDYNDNIASIKEGAVFSGFAARDMLGLPQSGVVKLAPGAHGQYDIFIQSTSINCKLVENTNVLVWTNV